MSKPSSGAIGWAGVGVEVVAVGIGAWLTPTAGIFVALSGLLFFIPILKEWVGRGASTDPQQGTRIPTLKVKYTDDAANRRYMRFEGNGGACTRYLEIVNESIDTDAQEVEVKVESCDQIPDLLSPHTHTAAFTPIGIVLAFERGGYTRTIRRQDSEWIKFLSFDRQFPRRWIQIGEYGQDRVDLHGKIVNVYTPHRIELTIRAVNATPIRASFLVKAESEMLEVRML